MSRSDVRADAARVSAEALLGFALFAGVQKNLIEAVLDSSRIRHLRDGELLLGRGSVNRDLYLVIAGCLRIHLDLDEQSIADLGPGDSVGEISVFDRLPTSAHAVALGDCTLLRLHESAVWELVESSHAFARNLLVLLTGRIRRANALVDHSLQIQREHQRNASIDALTGLFNRRWLDETLPIEMERARRRQTPLGFLMFDVDYFKQYNDRFGHLAGDAVLRQLAQVMLSCLRHVDMAVRYGGEEFAVLLPGADRPQAASIAERVRAGLQAMQVETGDGQMLDGVTVSLGVAVMSAEEDVTSLIGRADQALYQAKTSGRNRLCIAE